MTTKAPLRLAIVGGRRGGAFIRSLELLREQVELAALCDHNEAMLHSWRERVPGIRLFPDYERLLKARDIDAVLLATPLPLHARQSIQALHAGKHVLSEVTAAHTLDECWELVETVERTGLTYMMAENYCYRRDNMLVWNMQRQGLFGDITYMEGAYIHDSRYLTHRSDGSLTWRGDLRRSCVGNSYPTHSLGPLATWLGINREGGDRLETMTTFMTGHKSAQDYYRHYVGERHPGTAAAYWRQGDSSTTLIRTRNGVVIDLRLDWASNRPHNMTHYALQGTRGAYLAPRRDGELPLVWVDRRTASLATAEREPSPKAPEADWESLWSYADAYEHSLWRKWHGKATDTGHGGGDFFVIEEFVGAVRERRRPAIDVYDAVTWSCVTPLSIQSVEGRGRTVEFPDFTRKRQESPQRGKCASK